jgi:energy-coupling factor transporter ATP-binding protein EcfA2
MLTRLEVRNFKSLRDVCMNIGNLNVLIGPNNSGKSSVLQTLALLKQSVLDLRFNGNLVNLGDFRETVFEHDPMERIKISIRISPTVRESDPHRDELAHALNSVNTNYNVSTLMCQVTIAGREDGTPYVEESLLLDGDGALILGFASDKKKLEKMRISNPAFQGIYCSLNGFVPWPASGPSDIIGEISPLESYVLNEFLEFLYYVSSKRGFNRRQEPVDANYSRRPHDVGPFGENTIPLLAYTRDDDKYATVNEKVDSWLENFGLDGLVASITDGPAYLLEARNRQTQVRSNVIDVGFGLNQLIPIIVQCFHAPKGSLIMIEQPEAHLHPRAQAAVADFLIDVVNFGNRVIVETHSEHLLLRLQRRVAEGSIDPRSVSILYFEQFDKETKKTDITIDKSGYFSESLPKGFFEEGFQEAVAHLKALKSYGDQSERL